MASAHVASVIEPYMALSKSVQAETGQLTTEFEEFKRLQPISRDGRR
jgi:hypothetical protein